MKTQLLTLLLAATCITACQREKPSEVEQKRQELESKRNELKEKQELAVLNEEMKKVEGEIEKTGGRVTAEAVSYKTKAPTNRGRINGENVILRSAATVQSSKLDNFAQNESVTIVARTNANAGNEAIVKQDVSLYSYTSAGKTPVYTLPKGKAVILQEYMQDSDAFRVTYQHPDMGKLEAVLATNLLHNLSDQTWYQVRRNNGQTGWVLGRFLTEG